MISQLALPVMDNLPPGRMLSSRALSQLAVGGGSNTSGKSKLLGPQANFSLLAK